MDRGRLAIAALCAGIVLTVVVWAVLIALGVKLLFL
jgi:threonine/homoserine/homoserine lactone efflux protein